MIALKNVTFERMLREALVAKPPVINDVVSTSDPVALRAEAADALTRAAVAALNGEDQLVTIWVKNAHQYLTDAARAEEKRAS